MKTLKLFEKIKLEVENKNRIWFKGRKVALMEHIHFQNTGKSLQEQISSIYKLVREHDEKVFHVVEGIIGRVLENHEWFPDNLMYGGIALREHYGETVLHTDGLFEDESSIQRRI